MNDKPIFYDTDCLSSFLGVGRIDLLKKEYDTIIISKQIKDEFFNESTPKMIKKELDLLINEGFVKVLDIEVGSKEFDCYYEFRLLDVENDEGIGELSIISLVIVNNGILASNNLKDVCKYVRKYNLEHITTAIILVNRFNNDHISFNEVENLWREMLKNKIELDRKSVV